jgi:pyrroloquinoline quinone (PQQ) biosynthesis protein C
MKSKVTSPRLSRAIAENIAHETGLDGPSHIALARDMMRSLGVRDMCAFNASTFVESATMWLSDEFATYDEAAIAGWLLTAETLVPLMFARVVSAMARSGCDVEYFTVHVHVDGDEHSEWMLESVREILDANPDREASVLRGMCDAFKEVVEIPDLLWGTR